MARLMKIAASLALLALAACAIAPSQEASAPLASAASPNAAGADPVVNPGTAPVEAAPPPAKIGRAPEIDTTRKLEVVDVYVDLRERNAMRPVLYYLLRTEEWMIIKMEQTSRTTRHYRFQRVGASGPSAAQLDPLAPVFTGRRR